MYCHRCWCHYCRLYIIVRGLFRMKLPHQIFNNVFLTKRTDILVILTLKPQAVQGRIQDLIRGGPQIVTGLKLPFWGLSFVEFWCWGLIFGGQGGGPGPPPGSAPDCCLMLSSGQQSIIDKSMLRFRYMFRCSFFHGNESGSQYLQSTNVSLR